MSNELPTWMSPKATKAKKVPAKATKAAVHKAVPPSRRERLLAKRVKPKDCLAPKASMHANLAWVINNIEQEPEDISPTDCPSFEAWSLLLAYINNPQAFFHERYKGISLTRAEIEAERRRMDCGKIAEQLVKAKRAFLERRRNGESLN